MKTMIKDWSSQTELIQEKCSRETILKGLLFLMTAQDSELLLSLCDCGIKVLISLYETYKDTAQEGEFFSIFSSLVNMIKILYKLSKEVANDGFFLSGTVLDETTNIITFFIKKSDRIIFVRSANKVVTGQKNVIVNNENAAYDLLVYLLGTYKNISIGKENKASMIDKGIFASVLNLFKGIFKAEDELKDKLPQCLVQITAIIRNLSSCTGNILCGTLPDIITVLKTYHASHSELSINCLRILSKISLNIDYAMEILKSGCSSLLVEMFKKNIKKPFAFVRIAFILGNLTMIFGTACEELYNNQNSFEIVLEALICYLDTCTETQSGKVLSIKCSADLAKHFNKDVFVNEICLYAYLLLREDVGTRHPNQEIEGILGSFLT